METSQVTESQLISAVEAVRAIEKTWIPKDDPSVKYTHSFFSANDWWVFQAFFSGNTCEDCEAMNQVEFTGDVLRTAFPYLEVASDDMIIPHVHPNCRCVMLRTEETDFP